MREKLGLVLVLIAANIACIHKQAGTVSPWERVNTNMAALAQINDDVAKGIMAVQQAGTISAQQAAPILVRVSPNNPLIFKHIRRPEPLKNKS